MRIGVATGPVVVGDIVGEGASEEAAVGGETPNLAANQYDICLTALEQAETLLNTTGERWWESEIHRLRGELVWDHEGATEQACICFERSLVIARDRDAKSFELRAAMSINRLWTELGKQEEAHMVLGRIHGWFTDGIDTADLVAARKLLDVNMGSQD